MIRVHPVGTSLHPRDPAAGSRSVDEGAPGEAQEHVLEAAAANERAFRLDAAVVRFLEGDLAVVGVDEDSVGKDLGAVADPRHARRLVLVGAGREAQFEHLTSRVPIDQLAGEPIAAIAPLSITTRRSHSCSASSM